MAKLEKFLLGTMLVGGLTFGASSCSSKNKDSKEDETEIIYDEIIAGQTFTKKDELYYVAFYEYDSDEDLTESIKEKKNTIYKVDLSKKINQNIKSESSNKNAQKSEELKISGPTLIKIEKNKNIEYIEGYDNIVNYLNEID